MLAGSASGMEGGRNDIPVQNCRNSKLKLKVRQHHATSVGKLATLRRQLNIMCPHTQWQAQVLEHCGSLKWATQAKLRLYILGSSGNPSVNDSCSFSPTTVKSHLMKGGVALPPSGEMFRGSFVW